MGPSPHLSPARPLGPEASQRLFLYFSFAFFKPASGGGSEHPSLKARELEREVGETRQPLEPLGQQRCPALRFICNLHSVWLNNYLVPMHFAQYGAC